MPVDNGSEIRSAIEKRAVDAVFQDGTPCRKISVADVTDLAGQYSLPGYRIEIQALEAGIIPWRYVRNFRALSFADQIALLRAKVCVVGLGGLGGSVIENLARAGIGSLILIDGDLFDETNLNRQFLSQEDRLSMPKADAAAERVNRINRSVAVSAHQHFVRSPGEDRKLMEDADLIMDCLDNLESRFVLERIAKDLQIPMVTAAVAGACGHMTVICPEDEGLERIYGPPETAPSKGAEKALGCLSPIVAMMGTLEASEAMKILTGRGTVLQNRMLAADLMDNTLQILDLG